MVLRPALGPLFPEAWISKLCITGIIPALPPCPAEPLPGEWVFPEDAPGLLLPRRGGQSQHRSQIASLLASLPLQLWTLIFTQNFLLTSDLFHSRFMWKVERTGGTLRCSSKRDLATPRRATQGSTRVGQRQREQGEGIAKSLYCGFCGKEKARQGTWV